MITAQVEDESERTEAIATIYQILPVVTICSPALGGIVASMIGWRSIFAFLFAWAVLNALGVAMCVPETSARVGVADDESAKRETPQRGSRTKDQVTFKDEFARLAVSLRTVCGQRRTMLYLTFLIIVRGGVPATMLTYYPFLLDRSLSTLDTGLVIGGVGIFAIVGASASKVLNLVLPNADTIVYVMLTICTVFGVAVAATAFFVDNASKHQEWILALAVAGTFNALICTIVPAGISILMGLVPPHLAGALSGLHSGAVMGLFAVASAVASVVLALLPTTLKIVFLVFSAWTAAATLSYVAALLAPHENDLFDHDREDGSLPTSNATPLVCSGASIATAAAGSSAAGPSR